MKISGFGVTPVERVSRVKNNLSKKSGVWNLPVQRQIAKKVDEVQPTGSFLEILQKTIKAFEKNV